MKKEYLSMFRMLKKKLNQTITYIDSPNEFRKLHLLFGSL